MNKLLEAQLDSQLDYFGNLVRLVEEEAARAEPIEGDFCPCCGDILAEGHECF